MRRLTREEKFMKAALKAAKKGLQEGEVPIGAVVVYEDKVVAKGYNRRAKLQLASAHAEMMAIDKACKKFGSWRLPEGCELYVTLQNGRGGKIEAYEVGLKTKRENVILPCGNSGIWINEN